MKIINVTRLAAFLTLCGAMICLFSCINDDFNDEKDPYEGIDIIDIPDFIEPTTDLMGVMVSADYPAAVLSNFADGSTGAALVKRLNTPAKAIGDDTRLVVIKGSDIATVSDETIDQMLDVLLRNDFVAMETPTVEDLLTFVARVIALNDQRDQDFIDANFEFGPGVKKSTGGISSLRERYNNRLNVLQSMAATRADDYIMSDLVGEIVVFSNREYFQQENVATEFNVGTITTDDDGIESELQPQTVKLERTPYRCGRMADAVADWLNGIDKQRKEALAAATRALATRADTPDAINKLLNSSESFTLSAPIIFKDKSQNVKSHHDAMRVTLNSWGVHNLTTKKDYYYIQEKVLLKMGEQDGDKIFCFDINDPNQTTDGAGWASIDYHDGVAVASYDLNGRNWLYWFGAFFTRYVTSMDLVGNGTINLEEALPYTDNSTTYKTVNIGSESGTSTEIGVTWTVTAAEAPSVSAGFEYLQGWSKSNYFEMSTSVVSNDITVNKNTTGNKVTWSYNATVPTFKDYWGTDHGHHISHTMPTQATLSDIDINNEICWSVANPSEQYELQVVSNPYTGALLCTTEGFDIRWYSMIEEVCYNENAVSSFTLQEPFRASQIWRMYVKVDEMMDGSRPGDTAEKIENRLRTKYPDSFHDVMTIFDRTPTSVQVISANIKAAQKVFDENKDLLLDLAEDYGVQKYTIHWRCDSADITYREGYPVEIVYVR